jgi:hypothetical protein
MSKPVKVVLEYCATQDMLADRNSLSSYALDAKVFGRHANAHVPSAKRSELDA